MSTPVQLNVNTRGRQFKGVLKTPRSRSRSTSRSRIQKQKTLPSSQDKALKALIHKEIAKEKKQRERMVKNKDVGVVNSTNVKVISTTTQVAVAADPYAYQHFIECWFSKVFRTTDLAFQGPPLYWAYYLWFLYFMHIKRVGLLVGTINNLLPPQAAIVDYAVPVSIANYLKYLSPNKRGCDISTYFEAADDFFGAPAIGQLGVLCNDPVFPRPSNPSNPPWNFLTGTSDVTVYATTDPTVLGLKSYGAFFYGMPDSNSTITGQGFATWVGTTGNIQQYSSYLQKRGGTVPLDKIPSYSPDLSAYARCCLVPAANLNSFSSGIVGPTLAYNPELAPLFSINQNAGQGYVNQTAKSMVPPRFVHPNGLVPFYTQLAFTFIHLCDVKKKCTPRKVTSYALGGARLGSLYPQPHWVDGYEFSQSVQTAYDQLQANKGVAGNTDTTLYNLTNFATVAFMALQYRLNHVAVMFVSDPYVQRPDGIDQLFPQFVYTDNSWGSIKLPAQLSTIIESVGPIVHKGILRIPQINYMGKATSQVLGGSMIGPVNWSAYGFNAAEDNYYTQANLYSTAWCTQNSDETGLDVNAWLTPPVINAKLAGTGTAYAIAENTTWADGSPVKIPYYGFMYSGIGATPAIAMPILSTMTLNGTAAQTIITNYKNYVGYNNAVNVVPLVAPAPHPFGDSIAMSSSAIFANSTGSVSTMENLGYISQSPTTPTDFPHVCVYPDVNSISGVLPYDPTSALKSLTDPTQEHADETQRASDTVFSRKLRSKVLLSGGAFSVSDVSSQDPLIVPFSFDPPMTSGMRPHLSSIAATLLTPNSKFAKTIEDRDSKLSSVTSSENPPISFLVSNHVRNVASQVVNGLVPQDDALNFFGHRAGVVANDLAPPKKTSKHPALDVVHGIVNTAKGITGKAIDLEKSAVSFVSKDL